MAPTTRNSAAKAKKSTSAAGTGGARRPAGSIKPKPVADRPFKPAPGTLCPIDFDYRVRKQKQVDARALSKAKSSSANKLNPKPLRNPRTPKKTSPESSKASGSHSSEDFAVSVDTPSTGPALRQPGALTGDPIFAYPSPDRSDELEPRVKTNNFLKRLHNPQKSYKPTSQQLSEWFPFATPPRTKEQAESRRKSIEAGSVAIKSYVRRPDETSRSTLLRLKREFSPDLEPANVSQTTKRRRRKMAPAKPRSPSQSPSPKRSTDTKPSVSIEPTSHHIRRKRSFDDSEHQDDDSTENAPKHIRKRSRSSESSEDKKSVTDSNQTSAITTQSGVAGSGSLPNSKTEATDANATTSAVKQLEIEERKTGEEKGEKNEKAKFVDSANSGETGGFSKKATSSPSTSISGSKSPSKEQQTSSEAFAKSGFASLGATSDSPFASVGTKASESSKPAAGGFGAIGKQEKLSFGSTTTTSPFSQLGNSTPSASPFKCGENSALKTFASSNIAPENKFSASKPSRPFGASVDDEEEDGDESGDENPEASSTVVNHGHKDSRFQERVDPSNGEEGENTLFTARGKLYVNVDKQWKERGVGYIKVNVKEAGATDETADKAKKTARFIMRAEGTGRLSINSPITKQIRIQGAEGGRPERNVVIFQGVIDGTLRNCQFKTKQLAPAQGLYDTVHELQESL